MNFIKSRNLSKDIEFVRNISEKIEKKISQSNTSFNHKIDKLTPEELQDLNKMVSIADFMLCKYEDKKEIRSILEYFVSIIRESSESIEEIDDEVSELIISAEDSINKVKEIHAHISEKYDFEKSNIKPTNNLENSSNNLTKLTIDINSQEYQQKSKERNGQVI
ncbi:MAG TPA: hypothetical protein VMW74_01250 [Nitrosopumilaceae archaeon]|nr:hypothetical protein [Nitrosopumilaceae archaeon]